MVKKNSERNNLHQHVALYSSLQPFADSLTTLAEHVVRLGEQEMEEYNAVTQEIASSFSPQTAEVLLACLREPYDIDLMRSLMTQVAFYIQQGILSDADCSNIWGVRSEKVGIGA